ncbi:Gfo/Idh/MocA family protein [Oceanithermus sp.]|uniref:Gfo/Idh/MocA family protein n=1 Tax=Oceanithermus sp. TaxID=2268145 RepID=UPI0025EA03F9|nr:Gfo/Idh/MocA family oxidoreductase [Oceanithermus sp.]
MRIGILSFAHLHAEGYVQNLRRISGVEVIGFSDTDPERGRRISQAFGLRWFWTHEDLLAEAPDAVIVTSENARHREHVAMAAAAGVDVLCEKPVAATVADALAVREAVEKAGVRFMTAFPMRFSPAVQALREMVRSGELGQVLAVVGVNHSENPKHHRAWFAQKELAGGGATIDHTVHLADLYRWIFETEVDEVVAEVANPFDPEVDVDTAGLLLLRLENGIPASIDASWSRPNHYPRWGHVKMEVVGERGTAILDAFAGHLHVWRKGAGRGYEWLGYHPDPAQGMVEAFVRSVRDRSEPPVTWRDGFEALRVALAAYASSEKGEPVSPREVQ